METEVRCRFHVNNFQLVTELASAPHTVGATASEGGERGIGYAHPGWGGLQTIIAPCRLNFQERQSLSNKFDGLIALENTS